MSDPLPPPRRPERPSRDFNPRKELRIDPAAEVLNGRTSLNSALDLLPPDRLPLPLGNYLRPHENLDPVLRHHLRR